MSGAIRCLPDILSLRIAGGFAMNPAVADPMAAIRSFYFDVAPSASVAALAALQAVADPSHILFGTDFPMAPLSIIRSGVETLSTVPIDETPRAGIFRDNAARLLGRGI